MLVSYVCYPDNTLAVYYFNKEGILHRSLLKVPSEELFNYCKEKKGKVIERVLLWDGSKGFKKSCRSITELHKFRIEEIIRKHLGKEIFSVLEKEPFPIFTEFGFNKERLVSFSLLSGNNILLFSSEDCSGTVAVIKDKFPEFSLSIKTFSSELELLLEVDELLYSVAYIYGFSVKEKYKKCIKRFKDFKIPFCSSLCPVIDYEYISNKSFTDTGRDFSFQRADISSISIGNLLTLFNIEKENKFFGQFSMLFSHLHVPLCFSTGGIGVTEQLLFNCHKSSNPAVFSDRGNYGRGNPDNHGGWNMNPAKGVHTNVCEFDMRAFYPTLTALMSYSRKENPLFRSLYMLMPFLRKARIRQEQKGNMFFAKRLKDVANSICGSLSSQLCCYYDQSFGAELTSIGRNLMHKLADTLNDYFISYWENDLESHSLMSVENRPEPISSPVVVYAVTDSLFIDFGKIITSAGYKGNPLSFIKKLNYIVLYQLFMKVYKDCFPECSEKILHEEIDFNLRTLYHKILFLSKNNYIGFYNDKCIVKGALMSNVPESLKKPLEKLLYMTLSYATDTEIANALSDIHNSIKMMTPSQLSFKVKICNYPQYVISESEWKFNQRVSKEIYGLAWRNKLCSPLLKYPIRINDGEYEAYYALHKSGDSDKEIFVFYSGEFPIEVAPEVDADKCFAEFILKPLNTVRKSCKLSPLSL